MKCRRKKKTRCKFFAYNGLVKSGRKDLNLRPSDPQSGKAHLGDTSFYHYK